MNLLPMVIDNTLIDGYYIQKLPICHQNFYSEQCQNFYKNLTNKENGFYKCPKGLCTYYYSNSKEKFIFTSLKAKGLYNKKRLNETCGNINNPILSQDQLLLLIQFTLDNNQANLLYEEKKNEFSNTIHEVKKLNSKIREYSELLLESNNSERKINELIKSINVSSIMIMNRYTLFNYETNPNALKNTQKFPFRIFANFDKMRNLFNNSRTCTPIILYDKNIQAVDCYQSFENVPFLILENAVKYSYENGQEISVHFIQVDDSTLKVTVTSFSPFCDIAEINNIFNKGFRGKNAVKKHIEGTGIGLYFAKLLCDANNVKLEVSSDEHTTNFEDIEYSAFIVTLTFFNCYEYRH